VSEATRANVFDALADETRRTLLDRLRVRNGQSLAQLARGLRMSRQAVTKHLVVLENADLVFMRKEGRERRHYLNPVPIQAVAMRWLQEFGDVPLGKLVGKE
jgi:DNA-binding transcriptional ArsR family regulator